jgi:hypothetical protein
MGCAYIGIAGGPNVIATLNCARDAADMASITSASDIARSIRERMEKLIRMSFLLPYHPSIARYCHIAAGCADGRPHTSAGIQKAWRRRMRPFHPVKAVVDACRGCMVSHDSGIPSLVKSPRLISEPSLEVGRKPTMKLF